LEPASSRLKKKFQTELDPLSVPPGSIRVYTSGCSFARFGMKPKPIPEMVNSAQTSESHEITKVTGLKAAIQNPSFALGRKHMAHNHGSEYQVRIIHGDGTEELSGWLNSAEQVAQAIAADPKPQGKAYWVRARNVVCTECPDREERIVECPLTNIPSPRYSPHDSRYMVEVGLKSRYELDMVIWNRHRAA
jgi:hypothetical protein